MTNTFQSQLKEKLPPQVQDALGEGKIVELSENPAAMVNPDALHTLTSQLGSSGIVADSLLSGLRDALASSVSGVFLVTFFILLTSVAVVFFLKDRPLRTEIGSRPPAMSE